MYIFLAWRQDLFDAGFMLRATVTQQPDNTFFSTVMAFKPTEKHLANDENCGMPLEDSVEGYVLPPTNLEQYNDFWKGVQGDQNSCYMDASIFAMFSYLTVFDNILLKDEKKSAYSATEEFRRTERIRKILLERIVNPLRKYV